MKEDINMVPAPLRIVTETISTAVPSLALRRVRSDPTQPGAWLKRFRCETSRSRREELISRFDVERFLRKLEQGQAAATPDRYMLLMYTVAARRLEGREAGLPTESEVKEREATRKRAARAFGLAPADVAHDVRWMLRQLEVDHKRWLASRGPGTGARSDEGRAVDPKAAE